MSDRTHRFVVLTIVFVYVTGIALTISFGTAQVAKAANIIPTQWMAKIYTEALGRLPDQTAWGNMASYFQTNACSAATLRNQGEPKYTSSEFNGLNYDDAAKLLALYRGALDREPDSSGYSFYLGKLNSGQMTWAQVVDAIFTSSEFTNLASQACVPGSYYFGTAPAISIPLTGANCSGQFCFQGGTESQLQALLNSVATNGTVFLDQQAVVTIDENGTPLDIPAGKTLETYGQPSTAQYALMGRLVRASGFLDHPVVKMESGAKLLNVWVDGQRDTPDGYNHGAINIETESGSGTTISNDRISNTAGWSSAHVQGSGEKSAGCSGNVVTGNMVTVYSSIHPTPANPVINEWSDGLSVSCEDATVKNNQIVDATDVGIVLFRAEPAVQKSVVSNNKVLSAGNAAFGGIVADPLQPPSGSKPVNEDFTGSSIDHNTLWTGVNTWFVIGLSVGTRPWFSNNNVGIGASFTFNTTGTQSVNVNTGIAVSGLLNATVQNNTLTINLVKEGTCPETAIAAAVSSGHASGNIQQPYDDVDVVHCV